MSISCKAMILAAGRGTRLRPLTEDMPKPLVVIAGTPILGFAWANIQESTGIKDVFVNCHHASHKFKDFERDHPDLGFRFSYETELLGTGGGIARVRNMLSPDNHLLVQSGDVIADFDYKKLIKSHTDNGNVATIFTVPKVKGETRITTENGILKSLADSDEGTQTFANGYILSPQFLHKMPSAESSVIETFKYFLSEQPKSIGALRHGGIWMNLNDKEAFYAAQDQIQSSVKTQQSLHYEKVTSTFSLTI